jgi:hypothetical protein
VVSSSVEFFAIGPEHLPPCEEFYINTFHSESLGDANLITDGSLDVYLFQRWSIAVSGTYSTGGGAFSGELFSSRRHFRRRGVHRRDPVATKHLVDSGERTVEACERFEISHGPDGPRR